ncbi:hypothetical protein ACFOU0_12220 [Salinicoccus sesuvii]|uniref:Uncharacterized protein n=1 Tax=Salinicoccus sesuvii TaxID=868281 RepID=A0ABV7NAU8_9STAP
MDLKEKRMLKDRERTPRMVLQDLLDRSGEIDDIVVSVSFEDTTIETHLSTSSTIGIVGMLEVAKKDVLSLSEIE